MPVCLHILKTAQPECTGIARIVADLATRSQEHGYEIAVLFLGDGPLVDTMRQAGITTGAVPWTGDRSDPAGAWKVWRWMRRRPAAIAQLHHGELLPRAVCRLAGVKKIVHHVHGEIAEPKPRLKFRGADAVIACSQSAARNLQACQPEVIYAGIDVASEPPAMPPLDGPLRIGVLARLVPVKRIDTLIEAIARLSATGVAIEVEVAGIGPAEHSLRALAKRTGVAAQVRFLGWREDSAALLASWHALAMPSLHEGFPVAALEAMAAARPVIASSVGGLCEQVVDGVTGRLFEPGDCEGLVSALIEINDDRERAGHMGREGWQRARDHFSVDTMVRRTVALYDRLLEADTSS